MLTRINSYLSKYAGLSRRKADLAITKGNVSINNTPANLGALIDESKDIVIYNNNRIIPHRTLNYIALHKPCGYLSTTQDEHNRPTIMKLLNKITTSGLYPVGRLDLDSSGLLFITNDGNFALKITHPRYHLPKTYIVTVQKPIQEHQLKLLSHGVQIEVDNTIRDTLPAKVELLNKYAFKITLSQGIKRQIRLMCKNVGLTVKTIHRIAIGNINLGDLPVGAWRYLSTEEIADVLNN